MRGQILFFDLKKNFGIITSETGEQVFLSGHELKDAVDRNDWATFDEEPNLVSGTTCDWVAKNVHRIDCPPEFLIHGTVTRFEQDCGFIRYECDGQAHSIFFHASDLLRIDGVEPVPVAGCRVSFFFGQKSGRQIAAQVWIEQWPELEPTFEEQFAAAEELPINTFTSVATPQSLLAPATRNLTLLEIRQRRKGIQND